MTNIYGETRILLRQTVKQTCRICANIVSFNLGNLHNPGPGIILEIIFMCPVGTMLVKIWVILEMFVLKYILHMLIL